MAALQVEITRTAAADAQLVFNAVDPAAMLTDKAFNELQQADPNHADLDPMIAERLIMAGTMPGLPHPAVQTTMKRHVLGANGALLATWIGRAALAYTDLSVTGTGHWQGAVNASSGNVIASTAGFTPVAGAGGAVYEMREREVGIDKSGWFNIGSLNDIKAAIRALFRAA